MRWLIGIPPHFAMWIDAAGCFAGAAIFGFSVTAWSWTDLPTGWRIPVAVALLLFSVVLAIGAQNRKSEFYVMAVLGNILWTTAGAFALFATGTVPGFAIIAAVMLADGLMAVLQSRAIAGYP